jgi:hypothetical protein
MALSRVENVFEYQISPGGRAHRAAPVRNKAAVIYQQWRCTQQRPCSHQRWTRHQWALLIGAEKLDMPEIAAPSTGAANTAEVLMLSAIAANAANILIFMNLPRFGA